MAASAAQFDVVAGIDISSLSSVTQAQIMQMVNQIMPLSNIGGIIVMDGGGGTDWPGVTNNPRFYRYIWLDTNGGAVPVIKLYDQTGVDGYANWTVSTIADLSVTNAKIANATIEVGKIATTGGSARWVMRINAAGTAVEWQNPNSLFVDDDIAITALNDTGAPASDCFLQRVAGTIAWQTHTQAANAIMAAITSFTVSKLSIGSASQILQTVGGVAVWVDILTAITSGLLPLSKLSQSAATANQVIAWDGANWVPRTVAFANTGGISDGIVSVDDLNTFAHVIAHGLGVIPRFVNLTVICNVTDVATGWQAGDEFNEGAVRGFGGDPFFAYFSDATNVYIRQVTTTRTNTFIIDKSGGAGSARSNPTAMANFSPKIYAWV